MWLPGQNDFLHVVPVFVPENVPAFLPKLFAPGSSKQIHGEQLPAGPKRRRQCLLLPLIKGILEKDIKAIKVSMNCAFSVSSSDE